MHPAAGKFMFDFTVIAQTVSTARAVDSRSFDLRWGYTSGGNDNIWIAIGLWITCILMLLFDVSVCKHCCAGPSLCSSTRCAYLYCPMPRLPSFDFATLLFSADVSHFLRLQTATTTLSSCHHLARTLTPLPSSITLLLPVRVSVAPSAGTSSSPS